MRHGRLLIAALVAAVLAACAGEGPGKRPEESGAGRPAAPFLVFDRDRTQVWVGDLDGGRQRKLVDGSDPSVTADGATVYFQAANAHLASIGPDGSRFTDLGFGGYDIAASPDGKRIVYGAAGNIMIANSDGGGRRELATTAVHPVFTRDSRAVLFQAADGISRIPAAGGPVTRIQRGTFYELPIGEAADGRIIFISNRGAADGSELYSMTAAGGDVRLLANAAVEGGALSPDGRSVVFAVYPEGTASEAPAQLRIFDLQSGASRPYPASGMEPGWGQP